MVDKDPNYTAKVEKAIKEKYGKDAIQNPRASWSPEKEKRYLEDLKEFYKKQNRAEDEKEKLKGFRISKKLLERESRRGCPVCNKYSFSLKDDLYMNRFDCCFDCYIQFVEGREERWREGWRPDNTRAIIK